jgi:hypothetical protein
LGKIKLRSQLKAGARRKLAMAADRKRTQPNLEKGRWHTGYAPSVTLNYMAARLASCGKTWIVFPQSGAIFRSCCSPKTAVTIKQVSSGTGHMSFLSCSLIPL